MSIAHKSENSKGKVFMEASLQPEGNILYCRWIGLVNEIEPSKKACLLITSLIEKHEVSLVLNDNRDQKGPWPALDDWLGSVWIPGMANAGLKKFAHIHSENFFTEVSAKKILQENIMGITFKHFNSTETAKNWLFEVVNV